MDLEASLNIRGFIILELFVVQKDSDAKLKIYDADFKVPKVYSAMLLSGHSTLAT
jgi:hypothetical protein